MPRWLYFFLIFAVLAVILDLLHVPPLILFFTAALGIIPLAALIGQGVEEVAEHTGERIGGLLFATFGNATELIISLFALSAGLVDVVRASIIGTILGNALLVLGVAICVGSFKHGRLRFESHVASQYASLLALCVGGLLLPSIAQFHAAATQQVQVEEHVLSDFIAVALLIGYVASILFSVFHVGDKGGENEEELDPMIGAAYSMPAISRLLAFRRKVATSNMRGRTDMLHAIDNAVDVLTTPDSPAAKESAAAVSSPTAPANSPDDVPVLSPFPGPTSATATAPKSAQQEQKPKVPLWRGLLLLAGATIGVAILSEILVGAIEPMAHALGWNEAFVGLVFLPLIGGLPEYFNTINMALDKRMGMVLAASAGSSIQIALLVAPILVLVSMLMPQRLDLVFSLLELAVLGLATFLFSEITKDGSLVWLEGLLLILLFCMMASTVFLFGA
jgi:Ca2+:H+ antiporter